MSLEHAIHTHWSAFRPLTDLVPADRLTTGFHDGSPELPLVELSRVGAASETRTSSGNLLGRVGLRFRIVATDYDVAKRIAAEVLGRFNRAELDWSGGRVLDMKPAGHAERKAKDGTWELSLDFQTLTAR